VLDFIGQAHRRFRTTSATAPCWRQPRPGLRQQIEAGLPFLRRLAAFQLDRVFHGSGGAFQFCAEIASPARRPQLLAPNAVASGLLRWPALLERLRHGAGGFTRSGGVLGTLHAAGVGWRAGAASG